MIYSRLWPRAHSRWTVPPRQNYVPHVAAERMEQQQHNDVQHIVAERKGCGDIAAWDAAALQHSFIPQMMELKCIRREASKIIVCKGVDALLLHDDYA